MLALATRHTKRLRAYTISFPELPDNEEPYARRVAERYSGSVDYQVLDPPDDEFVQKADSFVRHVAEPFHSPNVCTTHGVWSKMAADGVRATLYGSAGDELFAGYTREYFVP